MKSLKEYILEGIFDDEIAISKQTDKSIINNIKGWAKTHILKKKGRMKSYMGDDGNYILEYIGAEDLEIDFLGIPDIVKIKVNNPQRTYLYNITDGFMEIFIDSEFNELFIKSGDAKFTGDIHPCKINNLYLDLDKCPRLSDFGSFKNCNIYDLTVSCHNLNKRSIDFDGLNIKNQLTFYGYYGHTGKNTLELIVTGKYNANDIRIQFLKVCGLPQKISGRLYDGAGLSWWDNDIKSIDEKLVFGVSKELFKEVYDVVTSKNFKFPKFNKAQFDIAGTGYEFNNPKELSIAMQAGYMRLVNNKYHYENSQMYPEYKSYELQFKNNIEGESVLKTWLDKKGYKLFNDYDLKPANMNKMLHEQSSRTFHILDKNDKIVASYYPLLSRHDNPPHIISTDKNIIDEIKNIK